MQKLRLALVLACGCLALLAAPARAGGDGSPKQVDAIVSAAVDKMWTHVDDYFHHGDYPRIIALSRIMTEADPHFEECFSDAGWLMDSLGRKDDAKAYYALMVSRNPQSSYAYYAQGFFLYNSLHDYPSAVESFQKDVTLQTAEVLDWRMLAHTYEKLKDWPHAVATWQAIKKRWPHGAANDVTHGGVDNVNLARDQKQLSQSATL